MGMTRRDVLVRGAVGLVALRFAPAAPAATDPRLRSLDRALRGPLLLRGSAAYERARQPYNARFAGTRPLAVAQPLDARDVREVVLWARRTGVRIAARCGGHSYAGYSTTPGVVVDLSRFRRIAVDAQGRASVGGGVRLYDVYTKLAASGLAVPLGTCPTVGVGGSALGGGFGLASRAWGLTCDNLVALELVTGDGRILRCDSRTNADLFWACRGGGGGNFGIVTKFVFRTHRIRSGSRFVATWPWSSAAEVVEKFQDWAPGAPDAVGTICRLATGPGTPTIQVFGQYLGNENALRSIVAALDAPQLTVGSESWIDLQRRWAGCRGETDAQCRAFEPASFAATSAYVEKPLSAAGIAALRTAIEGRQGSSGAALLDAYGGAINRVAPAATAFVHRRARFSFQFYSGGGADARAWTHTTERTMRPFTSPFAYQNYIDPDLPNWERAYYGANLPRLVAVKRKYDPDRVFRFAQAVGQ